MSENESGPVHKRQWSELTAEQRQAAVTLGYDAVAWDDEKSTLLIHSLTDGQPAAAESAGVVSGLPHTMGSNAHAGAHGSETALDMKVVSSKMLKDGKGERMFYVLEVRAAGQLPFQIKKRFSDFERLRKLLSSYSKMFRFIEFPKKRRMHGRHGKKDKVVESRAATLDSWLTQVMAVANSPDLVRRLLPMIEAWIHAQGDAADDGDSSPRDSMAPMGRESLAATSSQESIAAFSRSNSGNAASASSAVSARDRKKAAIANAAAAQREAKAEREAAAELQRAQSARQEEADMEAAIMASMGGAPPQAAPPPPTPSLVTSQQLGAAPTAVLPVESEAASRATLAVIEMGFEPAQVRQVQQQQLAAVGGAYETTDELINACLASG